jgi:uncharacterized protein YkwD
MMPVSKVRLLTCMPLILAVGATGAIDIDLSATQSFSNQDRSTATVMPMDGGSAIYLYGNTWRATSSRFTVSQTAVLEFEFASDAEGEIHGIGFDSDNKESSNRIFNLYGSQNWGIKGVASYMAAPGSFQKFQIPVGQYYSGSNMRLVLVNDNDVQQPANTSQFRNVKLISTNEGGGDQGGDDPVANACMDSVQAELLAAHNQARAQGRTCGSTYYPAASPLSWNCALAGAAELHSEDMASNNFFSHTGSDGLKAWHRASALGYNYSAIAENIAAGYRSVDSVMAGWLGSSGHCSSIMSNRYREMGAARVDNAASTYRTYWTGVFGSQR